MPPTDDEVVSMSGVAPVTFTVSASDATLRLKSTACVCETFTSMSFLLTVVNPCSSAINS